MENFLNLKFCFAWFLLWVLLKICIKISELSDLSVVPMASDPHKRSQRPAEDDDEDHVNLSLLIFHIGKAEFLECQPCWTVLVRGALFFPVGLTKGERVFQFL